MSSDSYQGKQPALGFDSARCLLFPRRPAGNLLLLRLPSFLPINPQPTLSPPAPPQPLVLPLLQDASVSVILFSPSANPPPPSPFPSTLDHLLVREPQPSGLRAAAAAAAASQLSPSTP